MAIGDIVNEKTKEFIKDKKILVVHNPTEVELKEFYGEGYIPKSMKFVEGGLSITIILKKLKGD